MQILLMSVALLSTYVLASDCVFLGLSRFLGKDRGVSPKELFFLTRGAGPLVISWLVYNLFLFSPHFPTWYYLSVVGGFFSTILFVARNELSLLGAVYRGVGQSLSRLLLLRSFPLFLFVCTGLVCVFIVFIGIGFPIVGHDSLVHAIDARLIYRDMSLEHYLIATQPDPHTGYIPVAFQIPFLQMLYVWFSLVAGAEQMDILARTVSPIFGLYCLLLVGYLVHRRTSLQAAVWAVFLLAVTPLFVLMSYDNAQDTPRYYFMLLALVWFAKLIEAGAAAQLPLKVSVGLFAGFAIYSHLLGAPAVSVGLLGLLLSNKQPFLKNLLTVLLISVVVVFASASYHYLASPPIQAKLARNFSWSFVTEWTALLKTVQQGAIAPEKSSQEQIFASQVPIPAAKQKARKRSTSPPLVKVRGQGDTPLEQFLLGRLQMFTGIEYFGFLFFLFWAGIFFWLRRSSERTTFDMLLFASALVYSIVVLSGVRKLSWSNPRYIGSLIMIGAYFSGPLLAQITESISVRSKGLSRVVVLVLIVALSFPALLVTTVRGAKVGITNTGTFYADVRSFRWLDSLRADPITALSYFWQNYVGIRQTIRYALASETDKLKHAHDYFATIQYFNTSTPADACALVLREGRYFYYAQRRGVTRADLSLYGTKRDSAEKIVQMFAAQGITHILIDSFLETLLFHPMYRLEEIFSNPTLSECVYKFKSARVYRLLPPSKTATVATQEPAAVRSYDLESRR